jgi:hypothetical protein
MTSPIDEFARELRQLRNADGGWGYYAGKESRLEPTAWATLALGDGDHRVLRDWPTQDGLLLERIDGTPNYAFHGVAMIAMRALRLEHRAGNDVVLSAIQRAKGAAGSPTPINRQNNSLQGWSWVQDSFSWVEPTAWCLLALKLWTQNGGVDSRRIEEAEALLVDRCCLNGGWNYGNANMLGKELMPHVAPTAVALLALQDRAFPAVHRSLGYLQFQAISERSSYSLSLALLGLRAHNRAVESLEAALIHQVPVTLALNQSLPLAMALVALKAGDVKSAFQL